jgi:hypothetical protein
VRLEERDLLTTACCDSKQIAGRRKPGHRAPPT